jgi:hypothetical protein
MMRKATKGRRGEGEERSHGEREKERKERTSKPGLGAIRHLRSDWKVIKSPTPARQTRRGWPGWQKYGT